MILQCACCGGNAPGKQWPNQDKGYGICARCFQANIEHEIKVLGNDEALEQALRAYGNPGVHHSTESVHQAMLALGVPMANHESDLYVPALPRVWAVLKAFPTQYANARTFINQADPHKGQTWIDIPFAFEPWWEQRISVGGIT